VPGHAASCRYGPEQAWACSGTRPRTCSGSPPGRWSVVTRFRWSTGDLVSRVPSPWASLAVLLAASRLTGVPAAPSPRPKRPGRL